MMTLDAENYTIRKCGRSIDSDAVVDTDGRIRILAAMYTVKPVVILYTSEGREFARAPEGDFERINEAFARQGLPVPYVKK